MESVAEKTKLTEADLDQFTGTEKWYKYPIGPMLLTDGVKFLAEKAGAFWLVDAVGSYQPKYRKIPFQVWTLTVDAPSEDGSMRPAVLTMKEDTDKPELVRQEIGCTDFPLKEIKLYFINGVLLLPSEY